MYVFDLTQVIISNTNLLHVTTMILLNLKECVDKTLVFLIFQHGFVAFFHLTQFR